MSTEQRVTKEATVKWVPINLMRVSAIAQREFKQYRVDRLVANFDVEKLGIMTVNKRDGAYYVVDGQHRFYALDAKGWKDKQVQCNVYEGLTEEEEADLFLSLNDQLPVSVMDKYKISVVAGRPEEVAIDKIIRSMGMKIGLDKTGGTIKGAGTITKIFSRMGGATLQRALSLVGETYGDSGLQSSVIEGAAFVVDRYGEDLDDAFFIKKLGAARGGVNGLLSAAEVIRKQTSAQKGRAVAAAMVQTYNSGSGNRDGVKKLTSWWKQDA